MYLGFLMGCKWQERESEKELADFWGRYYNIESQGNYWELKTKQEGL